MTKDLEVIAFNPTQCRKELAAFKKLLASQERLDERKDVLAFFKKHKQLAALMLSLAPGSGHANLIAFEFPFLGDFSADVVLGSRETSTYCLVEFEGGKQNSIFRKVRNRSTTEWSPQYEHGFSQLVDWCYTLDDFKKTDRFARDFGHGHVRFVAMLVVGRNSGVSDSDRKRLRWRTEKVRIDSHAFECVTFDDLYDHLNARLGYYPELFELE